MNRLLHPVHLYIFILLTVSAGCGYFDLDQKPETVTSVPQENNIDLIAASLLDEIRASAEEGDAEAQYNLGVAYMRGVGVAQDYAEALSWYRLAADQGFAPAQTNLGMMYDTGLGVPQSYAEAVKWFRLAADQGEAIAQHNIGLTYYNGEGVAQDYAEAFAWFSVAADNGDVDADHCRDTIAQELSPAELSQAQQRATELFEQIDSQKK
ncbi:MAG: tetratricopeptide repeat protein [Rubripirellula sp.]